jgi:hypothetical protein
MKSRIAAIAFALLTASTAFAVDMKTVLAPDGTLFAVDGSAARTFLSLSKNKGDVRQTVVVPATDDAAVETDARLLWDARNSTLFVVWHSAAADRDSIILQSLNGEGVWSEPVVLASCSSQRRVGLQTALTYAPVDEEKTAYATLIHAAWWGVAESYTAEYALVAFEGNQLVSSEVSRLDELANRQSEGDEYEDTGAPLHPPLAITRDGDAIDVVFGAANSTKLTRLKLDPKKVVANGRFWRPVGRNGGTTGPARMIAADEVPLQAFVSRGRIVLYEAAAKFRFVTFENGEWSAERMIQLDGLVSPEDVVRELQRTVDGQSATDATPAEQ